MEDNLKSQFGFSTVFYLYFSLYLMVRIDSFPLSKNAETAYFVKDRHQFIVSRLICFCSYSSFFLFVYVAVKVGCINFRWNKFSNFFTYGTSACCEKTKDKNLILFRQKIYLNRSILQNISCIVRAH